MSKPLPTQNTFAGLAPPWNLTNLDSNFTNVWAAIDDIGTYSNTLVDTGTVNALVCTPAGNITFALVTGIAVDVIVANTTTSATPTLNVNSTGANTIISAGGAALYPQQLGVGGIYRFVYDGTNWRVQNLGAGSGNWTATLSGGYGTNPTGTIAFFVGTNNIVQLYVTSNITGSSTGATDVTISGLPAQITPNSSKYVTCYVFNTGVLTQAIAVVNTNNTILLQLIGISNGTLVPTANSYQASGVKGIPQGWNIIYGF
jgi:hypothetical protein